MEKLVELLTFLQNCSFYLSRIENNLIFFGFCIVCVCVCVGPVSLGMSTISLKEYFFPIFLFQTSYYICFLFGYVTSFAYQFRTLKKSEFISSFAIILSIFFSVFTLIIITFSRIGDDFNLPANRFYLHIFFLHLFSDIPFRYIFVFYFDAIISTRQYQQPLQKKQN